MPSFSNKLLDIKCMKANCWLLNVILNFVNKARLLATNLEQYSNVRYNFDTVLNHLEHELLLYGNWIHFSAFFRYNKKEKSKELVVIQKGIRLPQPEMASQQPLLPAGIRPASLPRVKFPQPFAHSLPENTAGKTNVRGNPTAPRPPTQLPGQPAHLPVQVAQVSVPQYPVLFVPAAVPEGASSISEAQEVPRSTYYHLKRKQEQELAGSKTRKYVRSSKPIVCGKCGKPRDPDVHKQYFGNWYCQETESVSYEQWKERHKNKGYGKKKNLMEHVEWFVRDGSRNINNHENR